MQGLPKSQAAPIGSNFAFLGEMKAFFMRVRKRFLGRKKIKNIGCFPEFWAIFFGALVLPKWL